MGLRLCVAVRERSHQRRVLCQVSLVIVQPVFSGACKRSSASRRTIRWYLLHRRATAPPQPPDIVCGIDGSDRVGAQAATLRKPAVRARLHRGAFVFGNIL
jgi:hypothetical protein